MSIPIEDAQEFRRLLADGGTEATLEEAREMYAGVITCFNMINEADLTIDEAIEKVQGWAAAKGRVFHPALCKVLLEGLLALEMKKIDYGALGFIEREK